YDANPFLFNGGIVQRDPYCQGLGGKNLRDLTSRDNHFAKSWHVDPAIRRSSSCCGRGNRRDVSTSAKTQVQQTSRHMNALSGEFRYFAGILRIAEIDLLACAILRKV